MTTGTDKQRCVVRDERGATITEFALILPVFAGMMLGFLDFARWTYVKAGATGAIERVARSAGVGGATVDPAVFEAQVEARIRKITDTATFVWEKRNYFQFSRIGTPERVTTDTNSNGIIDVGDCWEDLIANGTYDTALGRDGVGGADDIVFYKVTVNFAPLIPISGMFPGVPTTRSVTAATIVKRQPFAAQTIPGIRCRSS